MSVVTSRLGRTAYSIEGDHTQNVKIRRVNSEGETILFVPLEMLVRYVAQHAKEKLLVSVFGGTLP